jgi:cardiolipin synthase
MEASTVEAQASRRVLTVPNLLSFARILLIPLIVYLIVHHGTERAGLLLFGLVVSTDWVDGTIARRTGQVSELGKILDPTADRLVIAAGLVAMMVRNAVPVWAGLLVLVRDASILLTGLVLLLLRRERLEVRWIGKVATFGLMLGIPLIAWSRLDMPFPAAAGVLGWTAYAIAILEYYVATALYVGDLRRAFAAAGGRSAGEGPAYDHPPGAGSA